MTEVFEHRRIRAPRRHGEAVVEPPLSSAAELAAINRDLSAGRTAQWFGRTLVELQSDARRELIERAVAYTRGYRDVQTADRNADSPIVLSGHQPQLFHPGVWFKNFALSSIGRQLDAWAINLLIDNDACGAASIRVPIGSLENPSFETMAYDHGPADVPFERRELQNDELFASFGERVAASIAGFVDEPILRTLWPLAIQRSRHERNLGRCIAAARHLLEQQWDQQTLELPLSEMCETESFRVFVAYLLQNAGRFRADFNDRLMEYRRIHRVRSHSHPVPELIADGPWIETPFWIWTDRSPHRHRLFVRRDGGTLELSDQRNLHFWLPAATQSDAADLIARLGELANHGVRIRPRVLATTMFLRLLLCDLFLHGIGGAKYDQLTDAIVERFFGFQPPRFMTLSMTARLVDDRTAELDQQLRYTHHVLRELRFHPERHLDGNADVERLVDEKRRWLQTDPPPGERLSRHHGIESINAALEPYLDRTRQRLETRRRKLAHEFRVHKRMASREFSFCLFPEKTLRPLLLEMSAPAP